MMMMNFKKANTIRKMSKHQEYLPPHKVHSPIKITRFNIWGHSQQHSCFPLILFHFFSHIFFGGGLLFPFEITDINIGILPVILMDVKTEW
jgi:hypothetical protein